MTLTLNYWPGPVIQGLLWLKIVNTHNVHSIKIPLSVLICMQLNVHHTPTLTPVSLAWFKMVAMMLEHKNEHWMETEWWKWNELYPSLVVYSVWLNIQFFVSFPLLDLCRHFYLYKMISLWHSLQPAWFCSIVWHGTAVGKQMIDPIVG